MKDIGNYHNEITFETEVFENVYWVPVNALGRTRYTNDEMRSIVQLSVEEKKNKIHNLYEAIQLFQVSGFRGVFDNTDHWIDNIHWQTHKSPYEAVISNEGCCATDTNWLAYFIEDKYDSIGSFCYANTDRNGHITTYIRQDGYYYFIDMMMCRKDSQKYFCQESGLLDDMLSTEWAGFLYKCKESVDFCKFYIERLKAKKRDIPYCFYMRNTGCVTATGCTAKKDKVEFCVPKRENPSIVWKDDNINHVLLSVDPPVQIFQK